MTQVRPMTVQPGFQIMIQWRDIQLNVCLAKVLQLAIATALLCSLSGSVFAQANMAQEHLTSGQKAQLESDLTRLVQDVIRENRLQLGSAKDPKFKLIYDQLEDAIIIDFEKATVPKEHTPTFDEHLQLIFQTVSDIVADSVPLLEIKFLFGGFDIYHYFPEDRIPVENPGKGATAWH
ncbi:hypothetical protein OR60_01510 [Xanthomonas vesicatoria]|uniref:Uncharacterized protein n=2 Tax=Xanthomonas vesicatoria TaxID=56460 RepID=A0AAJ0N3P9_9XANT|nr:hypothetical protein BI313_09245 [Xanthomonas vesicatoria]KHM93775.1 hypothetical protein OR61_13300 [Xanthomonas vesicatoria]KHM97973.1 hypothetical protein OR60_01510 [Xanthomonas vesicatoria]